jgi:hypothetical protein
MIDTNSDGVMGEWANDLPRCVVFEKVNRGAPGDFDQVQRSIKYSPLVLATVVTELVFGRGALP